MKKIWWLSLIITLVLGGCTHITTMPKVSVNKSEKWIVLPLLNRTETPQAGLRAEGIVESVSRSYGLTIERYPSSLQREGMFDTLDDKSIREAMNWAKENGYRYAITGDIQEWRYKVGMDGEPAVGLNLRIVDITTGQIIWSSVGAKSGWSREALSAVAQDLIVSMMNKAGL